MAEIGPNSTDENQFANADSTGELLDQPDVSTVLHETGGAGNGGSQLGEKAAQRLMESVSLPERVRLRPHQPRLQ